MKELKQITVIGLGLLGGSITLAVSRCFPGVKSIGFTHRPSTRKKARQLGVAAEIVDDLAGSVRDSNIIVLATPIYTFESIFSQISGSLCDGCIVTDVGSTKTLPHKWAAKKLPENVHYVGSHPISGSEQRGIEFSRDDLFYQSKCVLTANKKTDKQAVETLKKFWAKLGCSVSIMDPAEHDKILSKVSHLPHITAAALINTSKADELKFAGKGFIDTTRIASGPVNIWADILLTNVDNCEKGVGQIIKELEKIQGAIKTGNRERLEKLLLSARNKRNEMITYKMKKRELT